MFKLLLCSTLALLVGGATFARADFLIKAASGTSAGPEFEKSNLSSNPASPVSGGSPGDVHWKMAYGFGNNIPLGFACKQIVPPAVKVTYGRGVDPATPVTWKGGDTWNHVLQNTLKPLGWHLQMTHMAVEIEK